MLYSKNKRRIQKLMALSSGLTGKVTTLLTQAAELAIRGGAECISAELIDQVADKRDRQVRFTMRNR